MLAPQPSLARFNSWPGLLAKLWIGDASAHRYGGIYLFTDAESAAHSRTTPQFTGLADDPSISVLCVDEFDVIDDLSALAASPLLASINQLSRHPAP